MHAVVLSSIQHCKVDVHSYCNLHFNNLKYLLHINAGLILVDFYRTRYGSSIVVA